MISKPTTNLAATVTKMEKEKENPGHGSGTMTVFADDEDDDDVRRRMKNIPLDSVSESLRVFGKMHTLFQANL